MTFMPKLCLLCAVQFAASIGLPSVAACQVVAPDASKTTAANQEASEQPRSNLSSATRGVSVEPLHLSDFRPTPKLQVKTTELGAAKFPVVDAHTHFYFKLRHDKDALDAFVKTMDRNNIKVCVSLDGQLGSRLAAHQEFLWTDYKDRFVIFTNVDWVGGGRRSEPATWDCHREDFARRTVMALRAAAAEGISGLKVFKNFGLKYRNPDGTLIEIDDERFSPIWDACGELGLPVIMHTADPSAFFDPITPENERWEELSRHPDWHFPPDKFPSRKELHQARERLFKRHRQTTFIAAHLGNDGEDLAETARMLDENPNVVVEIASRISELGRQPYTARRFLIKYADRILFGTDGPWPEKRLRYYWRFLETDDEHFRYSEKPFPPQGFWRIYGTFLPDDVLKKVYSANAARIIPGVAERLECVD